MNLSICEFALFRRKHDGNLPSEQWRQFGKPNRQNIAVWQKGTVINMKLLLKGGCVFRDGGFDLCDLLVSDGVISQIGNIPDEADAEVIPLDGLTVFPGLTDVHVHLREPGFLSKETIRTGTAAAARGGFTTVLSMPNLSPAPDSMPNLQIQLDAIAASACVRVIPYGTITVGERGGELSDMSSLSPHVAGFSDDGRGVQSGARMREAMRTAKALGRIIVAHCEDESLLSGGVIHDGIYAREHRLPGISSASEWRQVARDLTLAEETGCAYHICHVSTRESVALVREAKRRGVNVTCETAPHYLTLTELDLRDEGRFKMNPPLRGEEDRAALLEGILDGTVDMIATDHAPHTAKEKSRGLLGSPMGITGLETAFPVLYTRLVDRGVLPLSALLRCMSETPARRFGLEGGTIRVGVRADLFAADLKNGYVIDSRQFASMGKATPFDGETVKGKIKLTVAGGKTVWQEN